MRLQQAKKEILEPYARTQINERLHLLERAIAASSAGIVITDAKLPDNPIIYCNQAFEKITGYSASEVIGYNCRFLQGADTDTDAIASIRRAVELGQECQVVLKNYRKDGVPFWNDLTISPVYDAEGNLTHFIGVQTDITARKQSEEKYEKLAANIPGTIYQFVLHGDGSVSFPYVSPGCREIWEIEPEEIEQNAAKIIDTIHPEDRTSFDKSVALSALTQQPWNWEGRIISKTGKVKWIQSASRLEKQANGDIVWDGLVMDISLNKIAEAALRRSQEELKQKASELEKTLKELQKTQTQLIQTEKMSSLGQLVAGIAHEINNPVNFIYANVNPAREYFNLLRELVQLYQQHYPEPVPEIEAKIEDIDLDFISEDLPNILASMKMGATRIRNIVESLRNFSRKDEAEMKFADIHQGLDSTLLMLQHRLQSPGGAIEAIKEYGDLPMVECYPGQLNQVFMNILTNAIDALEANKNLTAPPTIRIRTRLIEADSAHGLSVVISIADNGAGITKEVQAKLFDPFFTTKPVGKGTGLGLAISYQIVRNHGGKIECISSPGQGALFSIEIPLVQGSQCQSDARTRLAIAD